MIKIDFLSNLKTYPPNDIGIAKLFIDSFADKLIFCNDTAVWYYWNGRYWEKDSKDGGKRHEMLKQLATAVNLQLFQIEDPEKLKAYQKIYGKLYSKNYRDTILRDAMSIAPITSAQFDKHKFLFNCENGTYNFQTGKFTKHNKLDYLTDMSGITYDSKAKAPRFTQYLNEVMCNDQSKIDYLMQISAYCLTGDTSQECFFILYGDKTRNGKGTFVETLLSIAGTYAQSIMPSSITRKSMNTGGSNASPDIAGLKSARIASVGEIESGMMLDIALVKRMTGGNQMKARYLYENEFTFTPQFKLLIDTNFLPKMTDDSIFKSDRIHLIEFTRHFEFHERDFSLKSKLKEELSGIFNMLCNAYTQFKQRGFVMPDSTIKTIKKYQLDSNNVMAFANECLFANATSWELQSTLFQKYKDWCEDSGLNSLAKKNFKNELTRLGATFLTEQTRQKSNSGDNSNGYWVKGFSVTKIQPKQSFLTEIEDDGNLPF